MNRNLADVFSAIATNAEDAVAISAPHEAPRTYRDLDAAANDIAAALSPIAGPAMRPVALVFSNEAALPAALLGTWKAGRVAAPLDATQPRPRIVELLRDLRPSIIVSDGSDSREISPPGCVWISMRDVAAAERGSGPPASSADPALILYTSGSTGEPKGVVQTHRNLLRNAGVYRDALGIRADDRVLLLSSMCGGQGVSTALLALLFGAQLCIWDLRSRGMARLEDWLREQRPTAVISSPSLFRRLGQAVDAREAFAAVRVVKLGGEPLYPEDLARFRADFPAGCRLVQSLSSTETLNMACGRVEDEQGLEGRVPVGKPSFGMEIDLVDELGQSVDDGQVGEIHVRSPYLFDGYWLRPEATAAALSADPKNPSSRFYRTGDLGSRLPDGRIVHYGRRDARLKVRGHRVEPAEIERCLRAAPGIADCAVTLVPDARSEPQLTACYVTTGERACVPADLRDHLRARLPAHLIPARFVAVAELPRTANGKLDRAALAERIAAASHVDRAPAVTDEGPADDGSLAARMAGVWARVFGLSSVHPQAHFEELGGDSLQAMLLLVSIDREFGVAWPPSVVQTAPTPAQMTELLLQAAAPTCVVPLSPPCDGMPLFCVHGVGGHTLRFSPLAKALVPHGRLWGVEFPATRPVREWPASLPAMAETYLSDVLQACPEGPFCLAGYSIGGLIALEMAAQCSRIGLSVPAVFLLDTMHPDVADRRRRGRSSLVRLRESVREWLRNTAWRCADRAWSSMGRRLPPRMRPWAVRHVIAKAASRHRLPDYAGRVVCFLTSSRVQAGNQNAWQAHPGLGIHLVPGDHTTFLRPPHVSVWAPRVAAELQALQASAAGRQLLRKTALSRPERGG